MTDKNNNGREQDKQRSEQLVHELVQKITLEPGNSEAYYELATVLVDLNSYAQAEELLMKALGLFQAQPKVVERLHYGLGNVYYAAQDYGKAIAEFDQLSQDLKAAGYLMVAQSYMGSGDHKRALAFSLTALANQPEDPATLQVVAGNLLAVGNMAQAATYYDQLLQLQPTNGAANFDRGLVAMVQGEAYNHYFTLAKQQDPSYFEKGQKRLADIEKFVQTQRHPDKE